MSSAHLVLAGPEGADSQLHLVPLASLGARDVPHGAASGTAVDAHEHLQVPGAVAVAAEQEEAELDAVGVVLAERAQEQLGALPRGMLGGVDHQEGTCKGEREREEGLKDETGCGGLSPGAGKDERDVKYIRSTHILKLPIFFAL